MRPNWMPASSGITLPIRVARKSTNMTPKRLRPRRGGDGLALDAEKRSGGDTSPSTSSTIKRRAGTTWSQKPRRTTTNRVDACVASTQSEGRKGGLASFSLENGEVVRRGDKKKIAWYFGCFDKNLRCRRRVGDQMVTCVLFALRRSHKQKGAAFEACF